MRIGPCRTKNPAGLRGDRTESWVCSGRSSRGGGHGRSRRMERVSSNDVRLQRPVRHRPVVRRDEHGGHGRLSGTAVPGAALDDRRRVGLLLRFGAGGGDPGDAPGAVHEPHGQHRRRVTVRGRSGKTSLTYTSDVGAGSLPGPVYPQSLVDVQLAQSAWAAGRGSMNNGGFGYEPTNSSAQAGNVSDFLLRDTATGRLEWVTPLTLRNSSSQLFVAYAISAADTVTSGSLNGLSVYVLAPSDPRQINVDNMEAEARNWLAQQEPGFISSGGKLLEFTPLGGNMWRAYGELNGRVVYLLDIDATGRFAPALTSVSPLGSGAGAGAGSGSGAGSGGGSGTAGDAVCGKPLAGLSTAQIATCLREFADQLAAREGQSAG